MKNVYFAQPNNSLSDSVFLPYAAGTVAAYCFHDADIRTQYRLCPFIFMKEDIEKVVQSLESPAVMGFSNYLWNVEYNLALAEKVKERYPECLVIFGGPQVPDDTSFLAQYPFIDILIHGEGERAFAAVLKAPNDLENIRNISYRKQDGVLQKSEKQPSCALDDYPSPYTSGLFDGILDDPRYHGMQFDAILETNRGCPYKCIYCCWAGSADRFRSFPIEKVKAELLWMAQHRIAYCICADSNFGISDRDETIAQHVIALKKTYGYPQKFETTAAKNKDELNFRINAALEEAGLNRGVSVAVQSMSPTVLEIIGRKNMSTDNFAEQLRLYREKGIFTYTDIILGLPGETLQSFCDGLFAVIEAGQHNSININRCEFLPNTIMYSEETVRKYNIRTIRSHLCQNHSRIVEGEKYGSRSEIVVGTSTMSEQDWREAMRISVCVQSFHCMGLLRFAAIYLRRAQNVSYADFYLGLYRRIEAESVTVKTILDRVCGNIDLFLQRNGNLSFSDRRFGDIYWSFEEGLFLSCAAEADAFFAEVRQYLVRWIPDETLLSDLLSFQKMSVALPAQPESIAVFKYDWCSYFRDIFNANVILPEQTESTIRFAAARTDNWVDYAREVVWYGKRSDRMIRGYTTE